MNLLRTLLVFPLALALSWGMMTLTGCEPLEQEEPLTPADPQERQTEPGPEPAPPPADRPSPDAPAPDELPDQ